MRWRPRVRRTRTGFRVDLPAAERAWLAHLLPQLRQLLEGPDDGRLRRLFPPAYTDDPEAEAEFQRLVRDELVASRLRALDAMEATLDAPELTEEQLVAWMQSVNAVRLVLGTVLDITEDHDVSQLPDDHPDLEQHVLYDYLSALLQDLVESVAH